MQPGYLLKHKSRPPAAGAAPSSQQTCSSAPGRWPGRASSWLPGFLGGTTRVRLKRVRRARDAVLTGRSLCVLTQQLQRLNPIHVTVLQGGNVVDGVLHDQFQIRQFILEWEKKTDEPAAGGIDPTNTLTCPTLGRVLRATVFGPGGSAPNAAGRSFKVCTSLQST